MNNYVNKNNKIIANLIHSAFPKYSHQISSALDHITQVRSNNKHKKDLFKFSSPNSAFQIMQQIHTLYPDLNIDIFSILNDFSPHIVTASSADIYKQLQEFVNKAVIKPPPDDWLTVQLAEFQFILEKLLKQETIVIVIKGSQNWISPLGPFISMKRLFGPYFIVVLDYPAFPSTYKGEEALNFLLKTWLINAGLGNSPFAKYLWMKNAIKTDTLCFEQKSTYFLMGKQECIEWWAEYHDKKCPYSIIHFQNPLLYLYDKSLQIVNISDFKTVIIAFNLSFPPLSVNNNFLGYFEVPSFSLPPQPHLSPNFLLANRAERDDLLSWFPKVDSFLYNVNKLENAYTNQIKGGLDVSLALNAAICLRKPPKPSEQQITYVTQFLKKRPQYYNHEILQYKDVMQNQQLLKAKISGTLPPRHLYCTLCHKRGHSIDTCFLRVIPYIDLGYENITLESTYNYITRLPKIHIQIPIHQSAKWLLEEYFQHHVLINRDFDRNLKQQIELNGGSWETWQKFIMTGNRPLAAGLGAAYSLGVRRSILLRMAFGCPRTNLPVHPLIIHRPHTIEEIKIAKQLMLKKLDEGLYVRARTNDVLQILPWRLNKEKNGMKYRLLIHDVINNFTRKKTMRLPTTVRTFLQSLNAYSIVIDVDSCFDRVRCMDIELNIGIEIGNETFVHLGLTTGNVESPIQNKMLMTTLFSKATQHAEVSATFYDDNFSSGSANPELGLLQSNITMMFLSAMRVPLSLKLAYELGQKQCWLGRISCSSLRSSRSKDEHYIKLKTLIFHIIIKGPLTTIKDLLKLEGKLRSMLPKGRHNGLTELNIFIAQYAKQHNVANTKNYQPFLDQTIGVSKTLIKVLHDVMSTLTIFHYSKKAISPLSYNCDAYIITDGGDKCGAGYMIIVSTETPLADLDNILHPYIIPFPPHIQNKSSTFREQFTLHRYIHTTEAFFNHLRELNITPHLHIITDSTGLLSRITKFKAPTLREHENLLQIAKVATDIDPFFEAVWHPRERETIRIADGLPVPQAVRLTRIYIAKLKIIFHAKKFISPFTERTYLTMGPFSYELRFPRFQYLQPGTIPLYIPNPHITETLQYLNIILCFKLNNAKGLLAFPNNTLLKPLLPCFEQLTAFRWNTTYIKIKNSNTRRKNQCKHNLRMWFGLFDFSRIFSEQNQTLLDNIQTILHNCSSL